MNGKFRVFDKNGNYLIKYNEPVITSENGRGYLTMMSSGELGLLIRRDGVNFPNVHHFSLLKPEMHIVQFFTGLQDKNGNDIYDGDLLNIGTADQINLYFVNYIRAKYMLGKYVEIDDDSPSGVYRIEAAPYCGDGEIIGNIFENAELLRSKE